MCPRSNQESLQLSRYRKSLPPNEFAALEAWIGTFYKYQRDWMLEAADYAVCNKSRQIGISHTTSGIGVIWGAFHGELTTVISVGERESQEVLDKARRHASVLVKLGSKMAMAGRRDKNDELSFASGGRIIALPATGGRSFTGNVFLDEYAFTQHAGKIWDAAAAVTMLGYRMRVVSTPNGVGNEYEQLWADSSDPKFGWVRHEIPIEKAIEQGYPVDIQKCWTLAKGDPRIFDQLFRCKFLDNDLQYIPSDLLKRAFDGYVPSEAGITYGGLDIGESRDKTVMCIVRRHGDDRQFVHIESHKLTDDDLIDRLVAKAFTTYKVQRFAIDETGLGTFPAKRIRRDYGSRIEPVSFTQKSKEDMATTLYDVLATEQFKLPSSYVANGIDEMPLLRDDVYSIRRIVTSAGNVRYDAARTDRGHADRAWALMLALHAAGRMSPMTAALMKAAGKR